VTASRAMMNLEPSLLVRLQEARERTDALFALLPPNTFYDRPIPERHRLLFYFGHLEAFDRNLLSPALGISSEDSTLDKLFAFGIDPVGGGLPTDKPGDWPSLAQVEQYNRGVRGKLDERLREPGSSLVADPSLADGTLLNVAIEHRLMHAETLAYLLHNLPHARKLAQKRPAYDPRPAPYAREVTIPSGIATLGQPRAAKSFGWDNEFGAQRVLVPSFSIDVFPVTNAEYLKFVQDGGYQDGKYWRNEDWEWRRKEELEFPHFWTLKSNTSADDPDAQWEFRGMFGSIPLPPSWPVYVSHAEASAYARWAGKKLPTEEQWHRAAYGTTEGRERQYPWDDEPPDETRGNFHHRSWDPAPVDEHVQGASDYGVHDLMGNGWEWTSTLFGPLPGFEPFKFYPGYSADFFDGKHFVMKGGSPRTDACMLRRSFRNWFQPHYPYIYSSFRCVEE
jgi:gamma-glutamyl hercynylcysteine S-oxide synthase